MLALTPIKNLKRIKFKTKDLMKLFKQDQDMELKVKNPYFHRCLRGVEFPRYMLSQTANILAFLENLLSVIHKIRIHSLNMKRPFSHNINNKKL